MLSCNFRPVYFPIRDTTGMKKPSETYRFWLLMERKTFIKDLIFLKIRGLLKAFFVLLKHGHSAQDVLTITL
jgi:hypothetical protein